MVAASRQTIQHEAQALIELGTLLRKPRPDELKEQVQKILDEKSEIREKIVAIRKIDGDKPQGPVIEGKTAAERARPLKFIPQIRVSI